MSTKRNTKGQFVSKGKTAKSAKRATASDAVSEKALTKRAVKAEVGRRAKNKARRRAGERTARSQSWALKPLDGAELQTLLGEVGVITHTYKSGRVLTITAA